jgi:hypothetical protein
MVTITGKVLRILPVKEVHVGDTVKTVVDLIIADEYDYRRVSFWDDNAELIMSGAIQAGDVLRVENAYIPERQAEGEKRVHTGRYTRLSKISTNIVPLRHANALKLTVLAVARPEKGQVCVAGIDENGEWIRPQGVYEADMDRDTAGTGMPPFKNLCVSTLYVDAWRGRRPRKEDRFFVYGKGVEKELDEAEKKAFLEEHVDASVDAVFKRGRSLGLIKPRIVQVYEEHARMKNGEKSHERYIRFNFKDASGRIYHRWSCRCDAFYKTWNSMKKQHRWTYSWRMLRYLRRNETYLAIGLTYTDYGIDRLEYGAYPLIVGVHVVQKSYRYDEFPYQKRPQPVGCEVSAAK